MERFERPVSVINSKISKQAQQSKIGHICRQAKVAAVNYPTDEASLARDSGPTYRWSVRSGPTTHSIGDGYGSACMRQTSGLCQRLMQEMLTTKSRAYDSTAMSPIQCFLTGEGRAVMVEKGHNDGASSTGGEEDTFIACADTIAEKRVRPAD